MGNAIQYFALILFLLTIPACKTQTDPNAQALYDLADFYYERSEYQRSVDILQRITIEFAGTELAKLAENEIPKYQELERLLVENKRTDLRAKFFSLSRTLENYQTRYLAYPISSNDLDKLPASFVKDFSDSWAHPIFYKPTYSSDAIPRHAPDGYVLASFGKDGLPGGTGPNRDSFFKKDSVDKDGEELGEIFMGSETTEE